MTRPECCELCARPVDLTFHHLIPRKVHRRAHFQKRYDREQLNAGIWICRLCHRGLHRLYDEMTLARDFSTLERIQADEAIARHIAWCAKQKARRH
ncbi:hypothetical protein [Allohahella sp. A8]|uniref:hypothetical protein n=1 Tax=Allohahella sp. A8 TaxID=3141461 RepID=UPI000C09D7E6|nr:hypothetical protein [Hahellaceae bacterium]|tara:strand:+ start:32529 stop:32816 length:288 start_codon:yes stop_codon:yes gene_type:complete